MDVFKVGKRAGIVFSSLYAFALALIVHRDLVIQSRGLTGLLSDATVWVILFVAAVILVSGYKRRLLIVQPLVLFAHSSMLFFSDIASLTGGAMLTIAIMLLYYYRYMVTRRLWKIIAICVYVFAVVAVSAIVKRVEMPKVVNTFVTLVFVVVAIFVLFREQIIVRTVFRKPQIKRDNLKLSEKQLLVFRQLENGMTRTKDISGVTGLSISTVDNYIRNIAWKLNLRDRDALMAFIAENEITD